MPHSIPATTHRGNPAGNLDGLLGEAGLSWPSSLSDPSGTVHGMAGWQRFCDDAPELSAAIRRRFDAHGHKTMATLRRDGAPRISGTEITFRDGELWLGSMPGSLKSRDLRRDPGGGAQRVRRA